MTNPTDSLDLQTFRAEVRAFLQTAVPQDIAKSVRAHCIVTREQALRWQRLLHARGWAAPGWPVEHGGPGWTLQQQAIFKEELAASDAPRFDNFGVETIGPTIIQHGTPEQWARFLPGMLSMEAYWAQAYSEPGSGSDLASLRTTARREGNEWVVNGTKIWQSLGHWADWALVLVRTDSAAARRQQGISVLLIDLRSKGVTVRPIRFMNGAQFHAEIFFDEVRVPADNLLGTENGGWDVAKGLLVVERLFVSRLPEAKADVARLAHQPLPDGRALIEDERLGRRWAELEIRTRALDAGWWPAIRAVEAGGQPALEASAAKLQGNAVYQDIQDLRLQASGLGALPFDPRAIEGDPGPGDTQQGHAQNVPLHYWRYRGITLGGGTTEVQRGIVAKAVFAGESDLDASMTHAGDSEAGMLDDAVRRMLASDYPFDKRRSAPQGDGLESALRRDLHELGIGGLLIPARDGGFGGSLSDLTGVAQSLGEALVQAPCLWQQALATRILADCTGYAGRQEDLAGLSDGSRRIVLAHTEHAGDEGQGARASVARSAGGVWDLSGTKRFVCGGDTADRFIVSAQLESGGLTLFAVNAQMPGVDLKRYRFHDGRGAADLHLSGVRLAAGDLIAAPERAPEILEEAMADATVLLCAEDIGVMRRALTLTVDYMGTRKQFGRALSDFQALQHRVADHYRAWWAARALMRKAAEDASSIAAAERTLRVSAAKWATSMAARAIALDCLHLHGAVGLQDETPISHYAKRLVADTCLLGNTDFHLDRYLVASRGRLTGANQ